MNADVVPGVVAVILVSVATLAIGTWGLRISRTTSDFLVASRTVRPRLNASAIGGEYLSAASFLGVAGLLLTFGAEMLWYPVGWTAGYLVLLVLVAAPLRRSGAYTLPDFAEARLGSRGVRKLCSVLVVGIGWLYLLPQFQGAGVTLRSTIGAPPWAGSLVVALVVLASVSPGGMRSITFVQAFQFWLKLTALLVPVFVLLAVWAADGAPDPTTTAASSWSTPLASGGGVGLYTTYSLIVATFLGTMGLPHVVVRFYTNPDGRAARRTTLAVLVLLGVFYVLPPLYAALGRIYAPDLIDGRSDVLVLELPSLMVGGLLGAVLTGLVTAGAFAAFLSTSSGLTIAVAGVLSQDVTGRRWGSYRLGGVASFRVAAAIAVVVPLLMSLPAQDVAVARTVGLAFAVTASTFAPLADAGDLVARADAGRGCGRAPGRWAGLRCGCGLDAGDLDLHRMDRRAARAAGCLVGAGVARDDGRRLQADRRVGARARRAVHGAAPHARGSRPPALATIAGRVAELPHRWSSSRARNELGVSRPTHHSLVEVRAKRASKPLLRPQHEPVPVRIGHLDVVIEALGDRRPQAHQPLHLGLESSATSTKYIRFGPCRSLSGSPPHAILNPPSGGEIAVSPSSSQTSGQSRAAAQKSPTSRVPSAATSPRKLVPASQLFPASITQNSLPSGSARTTWSSSGSCPTSRWVPPRASTRATVSSCEVALLVRWRCIWLRPVLGRSVAANVSRRGIASLGTTSRPSRSHPSRLAQKTARSSGSVASTVRACNLEAMGATVGISTSALPLHCRRPRSRSVPAPACLQSFGSAQPKRESEPCLGSCSSTLSVPVALGGCDYSTGYSRTLRNVRTAAS